MSKLVSSAVCATFMMAGSAVMAAPIFSGASSGKFTSYSGFYDTGDSLDDSTVFWGTSGDFSTLEIKDVAFSEELVAGANSVKVGEWEFYNGVWQDFDGLFRLNATLTMDLDTPFDGTSTDNVYFDIATTLNPSADTAELNGFQDYSIFGNSTPSNYPFDLGENVFLTGLTFQVTNGTFDGIDWSVEENQRSNLHVYADLRYDAPPPVVPLPAAGWMLIAGLGGLAAMKRRKKKAA